MRTSHDRNTINEKKAVGNP